VEIVPPVAVHVTEVLDDPVTVAVNCCVCPTCNVLLVGDIETLTTGAGCIITVADADFVVSATEVAVTLKLDPAVDPAVYRPDVEIVPPVAVHVTAVLDDPVTVAVNCCVCPTCKVWLVGEIETLTIGAGCIVTDADADFVVSAAEVAVTVKLDPAVEPAVYKPEVEIVPPVAVHVTAVFDDPVTVAVNCCVCPTCKVWLVGEIETLTTGAGCIVTAADADFVVSAAEVAVTVKLDPAVEPAVYRPEVEIVPPVAVHVTAVFEDPVTVAVNCCV